MMKLLRRPLSLLFSASFSTLPPVPSPSLTFLQSVLNQIKHLSANPKHYPSLTTLDSLLTNTHMLNPATSLIIIDYLTQINKLSRAKTLISHLNSSGTVSQPFLYSLLFSFLLKDSPINHIESLWADICGSVKRLNFSFSDYVILVCKFDELSEVKDVYNRIFMDGGSYCLERQSYVALSAALCSLNEGILAKKVVNEMYDKGIVVDNWTYFSMFRCFCRNGDFDEADLALRKLVKNGFVVDICVYGSWIDGLCKYGKYREADKLFRKFLKRGSVKKFGEEKKVLKEGRRAIFQLNCEGVVPELMAYECYFRALCNAMKLDDAEVLLKKMMSGRALPETCVYGSFIKALFRSGRDEDAMKFFKVQRKKGLVRVDEIVTYLIMGLCENGKSDDALRLFDEILTVNGFVNGSYVCNIILGGYWKHDGVSKAELFFERWRSNEVRYGKLDVTSYTIMCNGYCSGNDVQKAVMVFEEMLKRKMTVNGALYERVIRLLCDCGRANEAFRYFNDMIENGHLVFCKRWRTIFQSVFSIEGHRVSIGC
ncbi:putative tetratricopeptide-like helical domain superfamily [Helianthus annuus]|uniref:Tetratricopeptide-like helical domain superfamily n=1 Tax=Helianthus annuus TaxID=4232 RepID=A0A9K3JUE2_HELAN|nr:putative pentatricopeptide repeat-containing protein At1g12700, mitochondrial [Helianthus annuus]XP_035835312.1 putative pentatricopeptide repeat-containing protein At1g12700, mitochondrial [Helianthus annuus]KAF5821923.1 putative tetratricopeptide-like helical domain superfamily [Helianthus annuus]